MLRGSYTSTIKHFSKKPKVLGLFWFGGCFFGVCGVRFFYISRLQDRIFNVHPHTSKMLTGTDV